MSTSLLYAAINNRLAAASLGPNAAAQSQTTNGDQQQQQNQQQLTEWESISHASDDELVDVASLPGTAPGTPRSVSRPSSPPPAGPASGRTDGSPMKTVVSSRSRSRAATDSKSKTDPLRALPAELSQRIFLQLNIPSLISCSAVSRRWRRSATLNFCWFKYTQAFDSFEHVDTFLLIPPPASPAAAQSQALQGGGGASSAQQATGSGTGTAATWTRREARTDWKLTFAKQVRMARRDFERDGFTTNPHSGYATPSRTERLAAEGVLTNTERRQQQWAEASAAHSGGQSKAEMRELYKSQGSRGGKVKGKSGKGGAKTGHDSIWD